LRSRPWAETDLEAIYLRIRADSPTRAADWRLGFLNAAQTLDQFPERCPLAPESSTELEIRQLLYASIVCCSASPATRSTFSTFATVRDSHSSQGQSARTTIDDRLFASPRSRSDAQSSRDTLMVKPRRLTCVRSGIVTTAAALARLVCSLHASGLGGIAIGFIPSASRTLFSIA
jgi:plasmid stabilization system protein ParE